MQFTGENLRELRKTDDVAQAREKICAEVKVCSECCQRRRRALFLPDFPVPINVTTIVAKENERPFPRRSPVKHRIFSVFLPVHVSFFGSVNLRQFDAFVVKENLHLVEQKLV